MESKKLIIETVRQNYSANSCNSMTIKELIQELEYYREYLGENAEVVLSFDNNYTYGGISPYDMREQEDDEE